MMADTNATTNPTMKTGISPVVRTDQLFSKSYRVAASITGIAKKKENSVAVTRLSPRV
jgi:hypothetical protein